MSLETNWDLQIDPSVFKYLKKIPKRDVGNILEVLESLPLNPFFGDIQKMKGEENSWRRRIGAYRLFYKLLTSQKVILVSQLKRRTSNTY